jgi:hypothetical protein
MSSHPDGARDEVSDAFDDGILEVYGPLTTRPRLSNDDSDPRTSDLSTLGPHSQLLHSEERSDSPLRDHTTTFATVEQPFSSPISPNDPVLQSANYGGHSGFPAAVPTADPLNDGSMDDRPKSPVGPGSNGDIRQITQDEDVEPPVLDDVSYQLSRVTADSSDDAMFERLDGHSWKDGVLFLVIRWKTDETSCLPFSQVKLDFPRETADYVLKHKLGCADGKYLGGRYTRWARQFNRQYARVVRRILRGHRSMPIRHEAATPII